MSYYGGFIELESAEWNDKKAVEYELAQAAWGCCLLPNCFVFLSNPML